MNLYGYIAVSGLTAIALFLSAKYPKMALHTVIILAPWQGLDSDFGLRVTAHQIVLFVLLIVSVIRIRISGAETARFHGSTLFLIFALYAVVWSLAQVPLLPEMAVEGGGMRAPTVRALIQVFMFLFTVSPIFIVPMILRTSRDLYVAGKNYVWSAVCLAILGWVQLVVWYATGLNPMPIGLMDSLLGGMAEVREGMFELANFPIYRMSSLAGEPKNLGASLVVAMILIQTLVFFGRNSTSRVKAAAIWIFLAVSAAATMSTTAVYLWILGTMTLAAFKMVAAFRSSGRLQAVKAVMVCLSLILGVGASASYLSSRGESAENEISVSGFFYARTIGRESNILEDFDEAIIEYLEDNPVRMLFGVGLGNVHLHADSYLTPEVADFARNTAFSAKAGYLKLVSELGLAGLLLFGCWIRGYVKRDRPRYFRGRSSDILVILSVSGLTATILYLSAVSLAPQYFLTVGVVAAGRRILSEARSPTGPGGFNI